MKMFAIVGIFQFSNSQREEFSRSSSSKEHNVHIKIIKNSIPRIAPSFHRSTTGANSSKLADQFERHP